MAATGPKKWNWWYERIADWMIANPEKTLGDCAREFNVSQSWLSQIINSDMFQDYWKMRSKEASDACLIGVREKGFAAAELALDALNKRLETQAEILPITTLLEITDVTMKRFGYGETKKSPGPSVQNNYFMGNVSPQELANARDSMTKVAIARRTATELVVADSGDEGDNEGGRGVDS
jgi:hypothetical protein